MKMMWKPIRLTSKRYFVVIQVKENQRDGQYFDIMIGKKGLEKEKMHYGLRAKKQGDLIIEETFLFQGRNTAGKYSKKAVNVATGKIVEEKQGLMKKSKKYGARVEHSTRWKPKERRLFLEKLTIEETGEKNKQTIRILSKRIGIKPKITLNYKTF